MERVFHKCTDDFLDARLVSPLGLTTWLPQLCFPALLHRQISNFVRCAVPFSPFDHSRVRRAGWVYMSIHPSMPRSHKREKTAKSMQFGRGGTSSGNHPDERIRRAPVDNFGVIFCMYFLQTVHFFLAFLFFSCHNKVTLMRDSATPRNLQGTYQKLTRCLPDTCPELTRPACRLGIRA